MVWTYDLHVFWKVLISGERSMLGKFGLWMVLNGWSTSVFDGNKLWSTYPPLPPKKKTCRNKCFFWGGGNYSLNLWNLWSISILIVYTLWSTSIFGIFLLCFFLFCLSYFSYVVPLLLSYVFLWLSLPSCSSLCLFFSFLAFVLAFNMARKKTWNEKKRNKEEKRSRRRNNTERKID